MRDLGAVQAQDAMADVLAVCVRAEGLTERDVEKARANERCVIRDALGEHGPFTRQQLAERWSRHKLPAEGQTVPHLHSWASMSRIICFGPTVKDKATHVLLEDWLPDDENGVDDPRAEFAQ